MAFRAVLTLLSVRNIQTYFNKQVFVGSQFEAVCSCKLNIRYVSTTALLPELRKTNNSKSFSKTTIISSLNLKTSEDAAPFYTLPISTLYQIQRATLSDIRNGFCENRLYYISSRIQCPPAALSEKLVKRTFVYQLSFQWIENSLNELLDKGVSGDRILRDLWVLKYHHKTIRDRLQGIKNTGIVTVYPWMVRCSPDVLNRYLKITQETKSILGDTNSTQMYLANRLDISLEDVNELCTKIPALRTIRATKVKHFLDFLLEEGFTISEIANKPRILASSQKTVKKRLEQLRQLGVTDINLNLLCRSKKDYKRICDSWLKSFCFQKPMMYV